MSDVNFIGKTIDARYRIDARVGSGGSARVYCAYDNLMKRSVALKILDEDTSELHLNTRSFETEVRAISMLSNEHIVSVYDVAVKSSFRYIVMELVEGITLRDYLSAQKRLSNRECISCALQVLEGLSVAHAKGIVHRDIKPQNIMILSGGHVKVADFGIARLPDTDHFHLDDRAIGTVHYISPEQAMGREVTARSDIYSLGCVMYEMLTGKRPFDDKDPSVIASMQVSDPPLAPRRLREDIPPKLEKLILRAMKKKPEERFQSAEEMKRALRRILQEEDAPQKKRGLLGLFGKKQKKEDRNEEEADMKVILDRKKKDRSKYRPENKQNEYENEPAPITELGENEAEDREAGIATQICAAVKDMYLADTAPIETRDGGAYLEEDVSDVDENTLEELDADLDEVTAAVTLSSEEAEEVEEVEELEEAEEVAELEEAEELEDIEELEELEELDTLEPMEEEVPEETAEEEFAEEEVIEEEVIEEDATAEIPLYETPAFDDMPTAIFDTATEIKEPTYEDFPVTEDMPITPPPETKEEEEDVLDASEFPFITDNRAERKPERDATFGRKAERPVQSEKTVVRERVQSERPAVQEGVRRERATEQVRRQRDTLTTGELRLGRRMPPPTAPAYEAPHKSRKGGKGAKGVMIAVISVLAAAVIALSAFLVVREIQNREEQSPYASAAVETYLDTALLGVSLDDARIVLDALAAENPTMPLTYRVVYEESRIVPAGHVLSYSILMQDGESIIELKISK